MQKPINPPNNAYSVYFSNQMSPYHDLPVKLYVTYNTFMAELS